MPRPPGPFMYKRPAPGLPRLPVKATRRGKRAKDIAAAWLALDALPEPEQRGALAISQRGRDDLVPPARRRACAARGRRHAVDRGISSSAPATCAVDERLIDAPVRTQHVQKREGESGIGAGRQLQMNVGGACGAVADRVDDDDLCPGLAAPPSARTCSGAEPNERGFAPQIRTHRASLAVRGSKPSSELPNTSSSAMWPALLHTVSGSTSVAPMRLNRRIGKPAADQSDRAGIVGVHDAARRPRFDQPTKTRGDFAERVLHEIGVKAPSPFAPTRFSGCDSRRPASRQAPL